MISVENDHRDAFERAAKLSQRLVKRLFPILGEVDSATATIAGAVDTLQQQIGKQRAIEYLHDLADRIEASGTPRLQ